MNSNSRNSGSFKRLNVKICSLLIISVFCLQLLPGLYGELSFSMYFSENFILWLLSDAVLFGLSYGLLNYFVFSSMREFGLNLRKMATEDGSFGKNIHQFLLEKPVNSAFPELTENLSLLIRRLIDILDEVEEISTQLAENAGVASSVAIKASESVLQQYYEAGNVASTTQEIALAIRQVADNSNAASSAAKHAGDDAQTGQLVIEDLINSINDLAEDVTVAVPVIESLANQSEEIGSILSVITGISEQTNLLALNAAIEAARAGEMGRGFAVVADEVRDLSRRTAEATKDIQKMILQLQEGSQKAVSSISEGKSKADESAEKALRGRESLEEITDAVTTITNMSIQTAKAVEEQSKATENINQGLSNLSGMVDESATLSEASSAAAQEQTLMIDYMGAMLNLDNSEVDEHTIKVYNYQNSPPFVVGPKKGLTYELVDYLNEKLKGKYKFVVYRLPRSRLDKLVEKGASGMVPWTSPAWHGDADESLFNWTPSYFNDANCIISNINTPFEYNGPSSMAGRVMGGVLGFFYLFLDDMVNKGDLTRVDVSNARENFKRLLSDRIDTALVTESSARYMIEEEKLTNKIHFSKNKHQEYSYQMLCSSLNKNIEKNIFDVVANMQNDPDWKARIARFC